MKITEARIALVALLLAPMVAYGDCTLPAAERERFLEMDYQSFDQSLPDGGWRGFVHRGCGLEAARLIDAFHEFHNDALQPSEHRMLHWHSAQVYAIEGLNDAALERFRKSFATGKANAKSMWNVYVTGTIAFLEGDRQALEAARDQLVKASDPNMNILRSMVRCFGRPYKEAYSQTCPGDARDSGGGGVAGWGEGEGYEVRFEVRGKN